MNLKIRDILECTKGFLLIGDENVECENFSKDTRDIKENDTYIGIKGESFNGSLLWKEALEKGADTVIIEEVENLKNEVNNYTGKNVIVVENTREALKIIATKKRELYKDLIVVGVTGSVGKTSTKDIIANTLAQKYKTLKTEGNLNNDIGLPFTILNLRDHEAAVIEMGMNHLGEIRELTKIAKPTISVITNIGTSHIGNLRSRENILKAKLEILEGMNKPLVIINNDNDLLNKWGKENEGLIEIKKFGIENKCECMANEIVRNENSSEFVCECNGERLNINVPVGGDVFILNALCAVQLGKMLGLTDEEIKKGIFSFELTKKRMEIIKIKNNITLINDSYNASFDSMKAAIEYLSNLNAKRKIAVLGDMFELGDFSEKLHREVGKVIADKNVDLLFVIGENSKYIVDEAVSKGFKKEKCMYFNSKEELVDNLKDIMTEGDVILFKASNGMKLFEIVEELK